MLSNAPTNCPVLRLCMDDSLPRIMSPAAPTPFPPIKPKSLSQSPAKSDIITAFIPPNMTPSDGSLKSRNFSQLQKLSIYTVCIRKTLEKASQWFTSACYIYLNTSQFVRCKKNKKIKILYKTNKKNHKLVVCCFLFFTHLHWKLL